MQQVHQKYGKYLILVTTSIGAFLAPFISSSISFAVPEIGSMFKASFYEVVWVPQSFLIALASMMLILGRLSDSFGRVRLYRYGFIIFLVGNIVSIFSPNIILLSISLFISGIGATLLGANSTAIISQIFNQKERGKALGINVMSVYLGLTLAPVLSGILITLIGWRSIFFFTFFIATIGLIVSYITMNALEIEIAMEKLDIIGGILFTSFIFSLVIFLTLVELYGLYPSIYIVLIGMLSLMLFFYRESNVPNPIMDVRIFLRNRTFLASNLTALLNYTSTFSIVFVFSIYLQVVDHSSPEYTGLLLISEPLLMIIFSPVSGILSDRYGSREIAAIGMGIIGATFFVLSFANLTKVTDIILPLALIGTGFGLFSAANTNSVMGSVLPGQYGMASGTLGTMRFTGQLLSIAIAGIILAKSISRSVIIGIFTGAINVYNISLGTNFDVAFRTVMMVSGIISILGVYTSLLKNKKK